MGFLDLMSFGLLGNFCPQYSIGEVSRKLSVQMESKSSRLQSLLRPQLRKGLQSLVRTSKVKLVVRASISLRVYHVDFPLIIRYLRLDRHSMVWFTSKDPYFITNNSHEIRGKFKFQAIYYKPIHCLYSASEDWTLDIWSAGWSPQTSRFCHWPQFPRHTKVFYFSHPPKYLANAMQRFCIRRLYIWPNWKYVYAYCGYIRGANQRKRHGFLKYINCYKNFE